jgi:hypothetical protein
VYYFTSVLFALPVFAALALGFWRARHNSLNSHHQAMSVS